MERTLPQGVTLYREVVKQVKEEEKSTDGECSSSEACGLRRRLLEAIDVVLSVSETLDDGYFAEIVPALLDTFHSVVQSKENGKDWNRFGSELGNLALRILTAVEGAKNFQFHFRKLLSSIGVICKRNAGAWRQVIRPLFNVFTNKKLEYVNLKRSLKEFKDISKCAESGEVARFTRQNLHLLQGFSMIALHVGDFLLQMDILEIVFMYTGREKSLAKAILTFGNQSTRQLVEILDFSNFHKDSRILLNALNAGLGMEKRIFSINCILVYFGNLALLAPHDVDGIWMDVNRDSRRVTIFCRNFFSNSDSDQCIALQLPLKDIEKLKLESGTFSGGDCYCITIRTDSLTEMYEFAKGRSVVCTLLSARNTREAVSDFVRAVEELSTEVHKRPETVTNCLSGWRQETGGRRENPCRDDKHRSSCTSPAVFATDITKKNGKKREQKWSQISRTSPLTLTTWSREKVKSYRGKRGCGKEEEIKFPSLQQLINVHEVRLFSGSELETSPPCISNSLNTRGGGIDVFVGKELSKTSTLKVEERRMPENVISKATERRCGENRDGNRQGRHCDARRMCEISESSCEGFILTQEFKLSQSEKANITRNEKVRGDVRATGGEGGGSTETTTKGSTRSANGERSRAERIWNTSLLDPNGYSYRRWLRPTTSDRSNFWLNKLGDPQKNISEPDMDVFHFTDEGELSDDSNLFLKEKVPKAKKFAGAAGRIRRMASNRCESPKRNLRTAEPEGLPKVARKGNRFGRRLNFGDKAKKPEKDSRIESGDDAGTGRTDIARDFQATGDPSPNAETPDKLVGLRISLHSNGKSEEERESGRGGKRTKTAVTPCTKRKMYPNDENLCHPAPTTLRNNTEKTGNLEELNDIAQRLSSDFEDYMREVSEWQIRHARKYAEEATTRIDSLAEEEEHEMTNRPKRFALCIQYYVHGCSLSESGDDSAAEMKKVAETVNELNGRQKRLEEKVNGFAGRLKETIAAGAEAILNQKMKKINIRELENFFA